MRVAYHAHTQATMTAWDAVLEQSKGNAINLDCGHYVAGTSESPIPLIQKHHDRIASMHLKDRKKASNGAANLPWGQGETPIKEILTLMRQGEVQVPGEHRAGIRDSRGFRRGGGDVQVRAVLQERAGVVFARKESYKTFHHDDPISQVFGPAGAALGRRSIEWLHATRNCPTVRARKPLFSSVEIATTPTSSVGIVRVATSGSQPSKK